MEQNQENMFVCKYCSKGYPCGKSLGGHIRTHLNNENCAEISINKLVSTTNATYDLRGNPKKSKRFSDESGNGTLLRQMICKECGKGFQSLKALCGHMACHSEKQRVFQFQRFEDHWDSQSDTETSTVPTPSKRRRSKRRRCKTSNNSVSIPNGSSSVSETEDQQEQEEVAVCLMMLSRDCSGCKKGLNSVVLEAKSCNTDVRISVKKQRETKLKSAESGPYSANSDSRFVRCGSGDEDLSKFKCLSNDNAEKKLVSKRNKGYKCPFCFRAFKSGQALGGHKRSHFVGVSTSEDTILVIKQDSPEMSLPALIDLNLPAPVEEDAPYSV